MTAVFIDCPQFLADHYSPELQAIVPGLVLNVANPSPEEVIDLVGGAVAAINDHTYMQEDLLAACPTLKHIVFMGTGASSFIDVDAAEQLGITVHTVRGYGDRSVAEHTIALMFAAAREVAAMDRVVRADRWNKRFGVELEGKILGVVGTGGIGREVIRLAHGLGLEVIAWNRSGVPGDLPCSACDSVDDLLARSDLVSLHLALTNETQGFLDARRIALMRPHAMLINTARAGVVDEAALIEALKAERIRHAALDVYDPEPLPAGHPLKALGNVTLTPHVAWLTPEASIRLLRIALEILRDQLAAMKR